MRALISAQAGVAALNEGNVWQVVRVSEYSPARSDLDAVGRLFSGSMDVKEVECADTDSLVFALNQARACDTALHCVLALLDSSENGPIEAAVFTHLSKLMVYADVLDFVANRLYATPLSPIQVDRVAYIIESLSFHPFFPMLTRLLRDQTEVKRVRLAWDTVSSEAFHSLAERDRVYFSAVERGIPRSLAQHPTHDSQGSCPFCTECQEVILAWKNAVLSNRSNRQANLGTSDNAVDTSNFIIL